MHTVPLTSPVSDWSIFCCGNSILHQKKERNENEKIKFCDEKQKKKIQRKYK